MLIRHRNSEPQVHPDAYVAPTATLVGDVVVGAHARVMYGAVLDAEASQIAVGSFTIVGENAVLRASAAVGPQPVVVGDHVLIGPHATLLGCVVGRCAYLATGATVLQTAKLGEGTVVAVGALVHAGAVTPGSFFVPPFTVAVGDPPRLFAPGDPGLPDAVRGVGFAEVAFGATAAWTDRVRRAEHATRVRSAEYTAHHDDLVVGEVAPTREK